MNAWVIGFLVALFTITLFVYVLVAYVALKSAVYGPCIEACKEGKTGCLDINGVRCCIGVKEPHAINVDTNCQPIT